ncbi:Glyoxylase I 4 [Ranunculus cassubicifolius]
MHGSMVGNLQSPSKRSVEKSLDFYTNVLGFIPIKRPGSFDFDGAWLFNYGVGIHLLQSEHPETIGMKSKINPKDNHISFQCESMGAVEKMLEELRIEYVTARVQEGGIYVDQLFFHDPDGFMIEICNCDNLPVIPLSGEPVRVCSRINMAKQKQCVSSSSSSSAAAAAVAAVRVSQNNLPAATAVHVSQNNLPCA